jgi:hypothetical protein
MSCSPIRRTDAACLLLLALLVAWERDARCQPSTEDADTAKTLFYSGRQLMSEQRWTEACPQLERSEQLDPGKGTEFNLADCYEHIGRPAAALALFDRVAAESHASGQTEHEALARSRAEALSHRVPVLVLEVDGDARIDGLRVSVDGAPVLAEAWSAPMRVEPGKHSLAVGAVRHVPWEMTVTLADGETARVPVPRLAELPPEPPEAPAPPLARMDVPLVPPPVGPALGEAGRDQRTVGLVLAGAGLLGLATGGVFAALSVASHNEASQWCSQTTNACTSQLGVDSRSAAMSHGNVATWLFVSAGAVLGAGAVVWLTAPSSRVGLAFRPGQLFVHAAF